MAITFTCDVTTYNPSYKADSGVTKCVHHLKGDTAYEGKVVDTIGYNCRVMSDVWEWHTDAIVQTWNGGFTRINVAAYCVDHKYSVDATDEVKEAYEAHKAAEARRKALQAAADAAERRKEQEVREEAQSKVKVLTPRKGSRVVVFKGRKVPVGVTGNLFWMKESQWGFKIGVKDDKDVAHWTYLKNVKLANEAEVIAEVETDFGGSFTAYLVEEERQEAAYNEDLPKKGDKVTVRGYTGKVFWKRGERYGVKTGKGETVWADANEVAFA